jgi:hypothetical protein
MRARFAVAALALTLVACAPVVPDGFTVFSATPYDAAAIESAWTDARDCLRMDGKRPWVTIKAMPIDPRNPSVTGLHESGRVLVEPSLYSLRHEFVHELLAQNTESAGREDYESRDPLGCFRVSWR